MTVRYTWLGHAAARIEWDGVVAYVDPVDLKAKKVSRADLVLLSNPKPGHTSPEDLEIICDEKTVLAGPPDALRAAGQNGRVLEPGDEFAMGEATVRAHAAFTQQSAFFPQSRRWLGYLLQFSTGAIYYAGMTDRPPEDGIRARVAFLPVSGRYVMDPAAARDAALRLGAKKVLPLLVMGDRFYRTAGVTTAPGEF